MDFLPKDLFSWLGLGSIGGFFAILMKLRTAVKDRDAYVQEKDEVKYKIIIIEKNIKAMEDDHKKILSNLTTISEEVDSVHLSVAKIETKLDYIERHINNK